MKITTFVTNELPKPESEPERVCKIELRNDYLRKCVDVYMDDVCVAWFIVGGEGDPRFDVLSGSLSRHGVRLNVR